MDPRRAFGQAAICNVRTESLAQDYQAGTSCLELADLYDPTTEQVDEATGFLHRDRVSYRIGAEPG